jgi:hypothetical protein
MYKLIFMAASAPVQLSCSVYFLSTTPEVVMMIGDMVKESRVFVFLTTLLFLLSYHFLLSCVLGCLTSRYHVHLLFTFRNVTKYVLSIFFNSNW